MPQSPVAPARARAALLHGVLTSGVLLASAALLAVRAGGPIEGTSSQRFLLLSVGFGFGALAFGAALVLRGRLPARPPQEDESDWWETNMPRALVIWGLLEGASITGAVFCFVTGSYFTLVVTAVGLLLLALTAPARLSRS